VKHTTTIGTLAKNLNNDDQASNQICIKLIKEELKEQN